MSKEHTDIQKMKYFHTDPIVSMIVNRIMWDGKKSVAQKIFFSAIDGAMADLKSGKIQFKIDESWGKEIASEKDLVDYIVFKISPTVELKRRRVGGANYQVPVPVAPKRALSLACSWLVMAARKRPELTAIQRLLKEISDILIGKGMCIKKREELEKMAEANRAFAHFIN